MNLTLSHVSASAAGKRLWLREGQSVTVGSSRMADMTLDGGQSLAPIHFRVAVVGGVGRLARVDCSPAELMVNGKSEVDRPLRHGDIIHAGNCRFQVAIDAETPAPAAPARILRLQPVTANHRGSGIVEVAIILQEVPVTKVLIWLGVELQRYFLCLNQRRSGRMASEHNASEMLDLFGSAPPEVRATDSLHVEECVDATDGARLWSEYFRRDAAILAATPLTREEFVKKKRCVLAWFARPSILAQQFREGAGWLAAQIIADTAWLAIDSKAGGVTFFAAADRAETLLKRLQSFEFQAAAAIANPP